METSPGARVFGVPLGGGVLSGVTQCGCVAGSKEKRGWKCGRAPAVGVLPNALRDLDFIPSF